MFNSQADMIGADAYILYLAISFILVLGVGAALHRKGRLFLLDSFRGNEALARSFGDLRIVSFYLIMIGFVAATLPLGIRPKTAADAIEYVSWKVGLITLLMGFVHVINVCILSDMRRRALKAAQLSAIPAPAPPPPPA
jgi:hypothetical protein